MEESGRKGFTTQLWEKQRKLKTTLNLRNAFEGLYKVMCRITECREWTEVVCSVAF
jgi:hypothetical protein